MAKPDTSSAAGNNSSNPGNNSSSMDINNNVQSKKGSSSNPLISHNMVWATKYHNNKPNGLALLHLDEAMMKQIGLKKKTSK